MTDRVCPRCKETTSGYARKRPDTGHTGGQLVCTHCGCHLDWIKSDESKKRRKSSTAKLVSKYSDGFCEMCLLRSEGLPPYQRLEAHHVKEVDDGGEDTRDNIWILCNSCHAMVHHQRRYRGGAYNEAS